VFKLSSKKRLSFHTEWLKKTSHFHLNQSDSLPWAAFKHGTIHELVPVAGLEPEQRLEAALLCKNKGFKRVEAS
jgi:hypothetical protein